MKIILLIRSYNRANYLKKTLISLFKSDLTRVNKIFIYDDKSNDKPTQKNQSKDTKSNKSVGKPVKKSPKKSSSSTKAKSETTNSEKEVSDTVKSSDSKAS